jgi:hypothetical protein
MDQAVISVYGCYIRGRVVDSDIIATDISPAVEQIIYSEFDKEIDYRLILTRNENINNCLRNIFDAYLCFIERVGPQPRQLFDIFVRFLARQIENKYNQYRIRQHQIRRNRARIITREIVLAFCPRVIKRYNAIRIQAAFRGFLGRRQAKKLQEQRAATTLQRLFRGWRVRRLKIQHNMADASIVAAEARTAVYLREVFRTEPFYANSLFEVHEFLNQVNDLLETNGWVHGHPHGINTHDAARRDRWRIQMRREVCSIALNFRGQVAQWWTRHRESIAAADDNPVWITPHTWHRDIYTHPTAAAVGGPAGDVEHIGLRQTLIEAFANAASRALPRYVGIDWSALKFSGKSSEIDLFKQTVKAIATQNNLPWDPTKDPPEHLPDQHGPAIIAGIAARFTGAASEWWNQLRIKPIQILVIPQLGPPGQLPIVGVDDGLLNFIECEFRSTTHNLEQLRVLQSMKWNQTTPLVEFNVMFNQVRKNAQLLETRENVHILIDYYCQTLTKDLARSVREQMDIMMVVQSAWITLANIQKLAVQKNNTRILQQGKLTEHKTPFIIENIK